MDPRDNRFKEWAATSGYYPRQNFVANTFETDNMRNGAYDPENTKKSFLVCTKQREKNKNQVVRQDSKTSITSPQTMMAKTVFMDNFVDQRSWLRQLETAMDEDIWRSAFDKYVYDCDQFEPYVDLNNSEKVVRDVLGKDTPPFVFDKFSKACHDIAKERKVYWNDFRPIIPKVLRAVNADLTVKAEVPPLIKLMNRPRLIDKHMGPLGDISTVYRDTIMYPVQVASRERQFGQSTGTVGGPSSPSSPASKTKPSVEGAQWTREYDPTSQILYSGTPKSTMQIPGYCGHIPLNMRNSRKAEHAFGAEMKPVDNNLMLTQKGFGCTLNYTGYVSKYSATFNERTTAMDPRTSNGAAFGPVREML